MKAAGLVLMPLMYCMPAALRKSFLRSIRERTKVQRVAEMGEERERDELGWLGGDGPRLSFALVLGLGLE